MPFFVDPQLYFGPPEAPLPPQDGCFALLERLGIAYARANHDHADTIEACHAVEAVLGCRICKNLFLTNRQQTHFYLLMMPGDKPFKTKDLSRQLGVARLSFASPEQMEQYLNLRPGAVSVLGLIYDRERAVELVIDRELLGEEFLSCHPCDSSATLRLTTADVMKKLLPALGYTPTLVDLPWPEANS